MPGSALGLEGKERRGHNKTAMAVRSCLVSKLKRQSMEIGDLEESEAYWAARSTERVYRAKEHQRQGKEQSTCRQIMLHDPSDIIKFENIEKKQRMLFVFHIHDLMKHLKNNVNIDIIPSYPDMQATNLSNHITLLVLKSGSLHSRSPLLGPSRPHSLVQTHTHSIHGVDLAVEGSLEVTMRTK